MPTFPRTALLIGLLTALTAFSAEETPPPWPGDAWRAEHRIIDLHQHLNGTEEHVRRAVRIMDRVGIGVSVNLSGGTVTRKSDQPSAFERTKALTDRLAPGRVVHYFNLDYTGWDAPEFSERAIQQVNEAHRLGAAGLKEYKRLGLNLRNGQGELIRIDDPKLSGVWQRCGELGLPVSIHVGDPKQFPSRKDILAALERVVARHLQTTFIGVHFANNPEDLTWVDQQLTRYPNFNADLAACIPELGRQDPEQVRQLFVKHADRILFGTDFQVYDQLSLGSSSDGKRPTDDEAAAFFHKNWRWLETRDRDWSRLTPIHGDWTISSIGLPPDVLRKIYFDNARRLLVRSLPFNTVRAVRCDQDFVPDGHLKDPAWKKAPVFRLEQQTQDGRARPELSTSCRALWSDRFLYLSFECPYTELTDFGPRQTEERNRPPNALWDRDVVEAFVGTDLQNPNHYTEYEWAPNGDALDLRLRRPESDFVWSSGMEWAVTVDSQNKVWRVETRIPLTAFGSKAPAVGTRWRLNLYRIDRAQKAFLATNPTLNGSFHTPERFGWIEFQ